MLKLFFADLKMMVRNRQSLIWAILFPVMFTMIFGLFFGKENNVAGTITIVNRSNTELAQNLDKSLREASLFAVKDNTDENAAKDLVKKNQISAVVIIPENFGGAEPTAPKDLNIYFDPGSTQSVTVLSNFINQYLTQASFQIQQAKPLFSIQQESAGTNKKTNYFDFVLAGVLGMALMNSSVQSIAIGMSKYREDKILKRITTTPLRTWKFIVAEVSSRLVLNLVQISVILALGLGVFKGHFYGNYFVLFLLALLGGLLFQLIGFTIAGVSKNTDAAEGLATFATIPMMFLAGVFFPIDALPKFLGTIVQYLPLAPLLRMLRGLALEGASPLSVPSNMLILLGWIIIALATSIWKFKLTED
jgi:ABC-2 type transport system permease protein